MKNKPVDLHNILFEQLERLNDLDKEEMESGMLVNEIKRADAVSKVSAQLINNGRLALDAMKFAAGAQEKVELPDMLTTKALPAPAPNGKQ